MEPLELVAAYVDEELRAGVFLDAYGTRRAIEEQAEVILATIRHEFRAHPKRSDTHYLTRSELTGKFCPHSRRHGALTPDELYLRIISEVDVSE